MGVRKTEQRIPLGYQADDLGQVGSSTNNDFSLIASYHSPVVEGTLVSYVIFASPNLEIEPAKYLWTITKFIEDLPFDSQQISQFEADPDFGVVNIEWEPEDSCYDLYIEVQAFSENDPNGDPIAIMTIYQDMKLSDPGLKLFFNNEIQVLMGLDVYGKIGTWGGHESVSQEFFNLFKNYVLDACYEQPGVSNVPPQFLASLIYLQMLGAPNILSESTSDLGKILSASIFSKQTEEQANILNGNISVGGPSSGLGVSQLASEFLAMVLSVPNENRTYTSFEQIPLVLSNPESPANQIEIQKTQDRIKSGFSSLNLEQKIDLFNLLRFPKSNIFSCAKYLSNLINRRKPNASRDQVLVDTEVLEIVATEYDIGPIDESMVYANPTEKKLIPNSFGKKVVKLMNHPLIAAYFSYYGGFDLQRGDHDNRNNQGIYGGKNRMPGGSKIYVQQLKEDLRELGFNILGAGTLNGEFDIYTEWAVREFQIYTRMPFLAKQEEGPYQYYIDSLSQVHNLVRYPGFISGVANTATRLLIQYWKREGLKCPVVISGYNYGTHYTPGNLWNTAAENIWRHDQVTNLTPHMYVRDFTEYYNNPDNLTQVFSPNNFLILGKYHNANMGGPLSMIDYLHTPPHYNHCLASSEVLPQELMGPGKTLQNLQSAELSTFKVIRSVAEIECFGFFDSYNAWDNAFFSLGPCHWTLPQLRGNTFYEGELCAFLSYLKDSNPNVFNYFISEFGVDISDDWEGNGKALYDKSPPSGEEQRKYVSWLKKQNEKGSFDSIPKTPIADATNEMNYFRTWHWAYRFQMACRTNRVIRYRMWDFARIRIRDVLAAPFPSNTTINGVRLQINNNSPTIGDIFKSELAIACLYRIHIYNPGQLFYQNIVRTNQHKPGNYHGLAYIALDRAANVDNNANPRRRPGLQNQTVNFNNIGTWGNTEEQIITDEIVHEARNLNNMISYLENWQNQAAYNNRGYQLGQINQLDRDNRSPGFQFDDTNLPPTPY